MEEEEGKGDAGTSCRVSSSLAVACAAAPPQHSKEKRRIFSVELKPGQTTIVSWKKLLKESNNIKGTENHNVSTEDDAPVVGSVGGPTAAAVEVQLLQGELQDEQPSNRFSAVIEKIERLYMGDQSNDEEALDDIPDDYQYDTDDSFIDDVELDEYFQVDKLSTKHNGYFVNRGKLEGIETCSSLNLAPKKRKRKDSTEVDNETKGGQVTRDHGTMCDERIRTAARSEPLIGNEIASPAGDQTANGEHHQGNFLKNKINTSTRTSRPVTFTTNVENTSSGRISKDVSSQSVESNRRRGVPPSRDSTNKSRTINESVNPVHHSSGERIVSSQVQSPSWKSLSCEHEAEISTKIRWKETYETNSISRMDSTVGTYPMQVAQPSSTRVKDSSTGRPKSTTLERAIHDLEKIVALCRPQKLDVQEVDTSCQGVKRRLPPDVKQRLAKVARLWRHMREIAGMGLSSNQEKRDRIRLIKQEINKMTRKHVLLLKSKVAEQQVGSADGFQVNGTDARRALRKYCMDTALEDRISELYDLYVGGIDED